MSSSSTLVDYYTKSSRNNNRDHQNRGGRGGGFKSCPFRGASTGNGFINARLNEAQPYFMIMQYGYYPTNEYCDPSTVMPIMTTTTTAAMALPHQAADGETTEPVEIDDESSITRPPSPSSSIQLPQRAGLLSIPQPIVPPFSSYYGPMMIQALRTPVIPQIHPKPLDYADLPPNLHIPPMVHPAPINQMAMGPVMPWRQPDGTVLYAQYLPPQGYFMPAPMPAPFNSLPPHGLNGKPRAPRNQNQRPSAPQRIYQAAEFFPDTNYQQYMQQPVAELADSMAAMTTAFESSYVSMAPPPQHQQPNAPSTNTTTGSVSHASPYRHVMPTPPTSAKATSSKPEGDHQHTDEFVPSREQSPSLFTEQVDDHMAAGNENSYQTPVMPTSKLSPNDQPSGSRLRVDYNKLSPEYFKMLTQGAQQLVIDLSPHAEERKRWDAAMLTLKEILASILPGVNVHRFGSTVSGLALSGADLDACLLSTDVEGEENLIEKLASRFREFDMKDVKILTKARVPTVRMKEPASGVRINLCIQSLLSLRVSRMIQTYVELDPRVLPLTTVVKHWARRRNVNEPYYGTLSSYCYMLMIIFLLQNRNALPSLQNIPPLSSANTTSPSPKPEGTETEAASASRSDDYFFEELDQLSEYWTGSNEETVGELLIAFYKYYSTEFPYVHGIASVRTGKIIPKEKKGWTKERQHMQDASRPPGMKERFWLCVEDPFEPLINVGRPCDKVSLYQLRGEFIRASKILCFGNINDNPLAKVFDRDGAVQQYRRGRNALAPSNVSQHHMPGVANMISGVAMPPRLMGILNF